jgi:flavin-dependent dehydrogenase
MYDAIIVGARCSGASVARLLAQKGYRVLVVDKAQFPSDTISTHLIWQAGLARAKGWGLLDGITGLGAPPIRQIRLDVGEFDFAGYPPPLDGIDYALAPRRILLDQLMIDAAVKSGAEFRERFYVNEIVADEGCVTGIRGHTEDGSTVVEKARMLWARMVRARVWLMQCALQNTTPGRQRLALTMRIGRAARRSPILRPTLGRIGAAPCCRPMMD